MALMRDWPVSDERWKEPAERLLALIRMIQPCPADALQWSARRDLGWTTNQTTQTMAWLSINNWARVDDQHFWHARKQPANAHSSPNQPHRSDAERYVCRTPAFGKFASINVRQCSVCKQRGHDKRNCPQFVRVDAAKPVTSIGIDVDLQV